MSFNHCEQAPIVILATQIIEDVSDLCTKMEILNGHVTDEDHHVHDEVPVPVLGEGAR